MILYLTNVETWFDGCGSYRASLGIFDTREAAEKAIENYKQVLLKIYEIGDVWNPLDYKDVVERNSEDDFSIEEIELNKEYSFNTKFKGGISLGGHAE